MGFHLPKTKHTLTFQTEEIREKSQDEFESENLADFGEADDDQPEQEIEIELQVQK